MRSSGAMIKQKTLLTLNLQRTATPAPPVGMLRQRNISRHRKGVEMIEFAIVLPALIFMLLFSVDMGRNIFVGGQLQDAASISARDAAQVGGAAVGSTAYTTFYDALSSIPGVTPSEGTWTVIDGQYCGLPSGNTNTSPSEYVVIKVTYPEKTITPGLGAILRFFTGSSPQLVAVGVARCEVVR